MITTWHSNPPTCPTNALSAQQRSECTSCSRITFIQRIVRSLRRTTRTRARRRQLPHQAEATRCWSLYESTTKSRLFLSLQRKWMTWRVILLVSCTTEFSWLLPEQLWYLRDSERDYSIEAIKTFSFLFKIELTQEQQILPLKHHSSDLIRRWLQNSNRDNDNFNAPIRKPRLANKNDRNLTVDHWLNYFYKH